MPAHHLYDTWFRYLRELLPQERITRVRNVVWMIVGMYLSQSVHLEKIAGKLPLAKTRRSTVQRFSCFLQNMHFNVRRWYRPIARQLLKQAMAHGAVRFMVWNGAWQELYSQTLMSNAPLVGDWWTWTLPGGVRAPQSEVYMGHQCLIDSSQRPVYGLSPANAETYARPWPPQRRTYVDAVIRIVIP